MTAITFGSVRVDQLMPAFGMRAIHAAIDFSIDDQGCADACADGDGVKSFCIASRALPVFAKCGGIGVIFKTHADVESFIKPLNDRDVAPTFKCVWIIDDAVDGIHWTCCADADSQKG